MNSVPGGSTSGAPSSAWRRWVVRPQSLAWRRFVAQVHLWVGLGLAAYVVIFSLTGSLIVLRPEFHRWLTRPVIEVSGPRPTADALDSALRRAYPGYKIESIRPPRRLDNPYVVKLSGNGMTRERLFDPYASVDMGAANPRVLHGVEWLVRLHDNLLVGGAGRVANGIGGALLTVLALTGVIIWWPGAGHWRKALSPGRPAPTHQFASRLHAATGFWVSTLMLIWGVTAIYFAFPGVFDGLIDLLDADPGDEYRPGEGMLDAMVRLHFGRFGGMAGRVAWIVLGLLPTLLAVTGFIMWFRRRARKQKTPH